MTNPTDIVKTISLDEREHATCLAALRYWQREGWISEGHEHDIATADGSFDALDTTEIANLCDRETPKPTGKRVKMVCATCGSEDVKADAYGAWNVEAQEWDLVDTFDKGSVCEDCGGECRIDEVEIVPGPMEGLHVDDVTRFQSTRIAIHQGHTEVAAEPDWTGTVSEYWMSNPDTVTFGDITEMLTDLKTQGFHRIGGGAQGCFTVKPVEVEAAKPFVLTAETTFEEFSASKRRVTDANEIAKVYGHDLLDFEKSQAALVYADNFVIEECRGDNEGKFYLLIENRDWLSEDLTQLERHLYEFAMLEYGFDPAPKTDDDLIAEAVEAAINAGCLVIQNAIGQTDGGVAGVHFSGDTERFRIAAVFIDYLRTERSMGGEGGAS